MKKSHQAPIEIDKQIVNLMSLGLQIEDRNYAKIVLELCILL